MESESNESEEQEFLVYVDFEGNLLPGDLDEPNMKINIIGIDSEHPVIEVNGKISEGTYDYSIGTHVFFKKNKEHPPLDPLYDLCPRQMYKFYAKTNKVLKMRRILVESVENNDKELKDELLEKEVERLKTDMKYEDALNLLKPHTSEEVNEDLSENLEEDRQFEDINEEFPEDFDEYIPFEDINEEFAEDSDEETSFDNIFEAFTKSLEADTQFEDNEENSDVETPFDNINEGFSEHLDVETSTEKTNEDENLDAETSIENTNEDENLDAEISIESTNEEENLDAETSIEKTNEEFSETLEDINKE